MTRGRPRPCALRRALARQAPGHAPDAVRVPARDPRPTPRRARASGWPDSERRRLVRRRGAGRAARGRRALAGRSRARQVLAALAGGREATCAGAARARSRCSRARSVYGEGKSWGGAVPIGPRVLTTLSAAGRIVRASNDGGWIDVAPALGGDERRGSGRSSTRRPRPKASPASSSAGCAPSAPGRRPTSSGGSGRRSPRCARRSPTSTRSRSDLDGARTGYLLPDDLEPTEPGRAVGRPAPVARPDDDGLDRARLVPRPPQGSSSSTRTATRARRPGGTGGSSAAGARTSDGEVVAAAARGRGRRGRGPRSSVEAARLTEWFGGARVLPRFPSPLSKAAGA